MKANSYDIKACLMSYYRFKKRYVCIDECTCCGVSDILVDTGKAIYDIEIKVSKSDLIRGEARKYKHESYRTCKGKKGYPNKFYICVPDYLKEVAEQWVEETNDKYGIILFKTDIEFNYRTDFLIALQFLKTAKCLNKQYSGEYFKEIIAKRLSSSVANTMQKEILTKYRKGNNGL